MSPQQPILLVEDSPEDYEATVRALRRAGLANPIVRCEDGDDALDYLFHRGRYAGGADAPRPGIVLLDLNLPGTDGREVLAAAKADPTLRRIPIVVLTTSTDERDVEKCYAAGANSYISKPVDLDGFMRAIRRLKDFWFEVVIVPRTG
ncbi:response regulator [Gemmata sp.]|uniref:response regulator n=1 Tax=Gemmata sp. TaxID=1914242 RepID=UPI003F700000